MEWLREVVFIMVSGSVEGVARNVVLVSLEGQDPFFVPAIMRSLVMVKPSPRTRRVYVPFGMWRSQFEGMTMGSLRRRGVFSSRMSA